MFGSLEYDATDLNDCILALYLEYLEWLDNLGDQIEIKKCTLLLITMLVLLISSLY